MGQPGSASRFIIQVDWHEGKPDLEAIERLLAETGIELDHGYGPVLVNPKEGRYVVRGTASPKAKEKAARIPGVRLFADVQQKPAPR